MNTKWSFKPKTAETTLEAEKPMMMTMGLKMGAKREETAQS